MSCWMRPCGVMPARRSGSSSGDEENDQWGRMVGRRRWEERGAIRLADAVDSDCVPQLRAKGLAGLFGLGAGGGMDDVLERGPQPQGQIGFNRRGLSVDGRGDSGQRERPHTPL